METDRFALAHREKDNFIAVKRSIRGADLEMAWCPWERDLSHQLAMADER